MKFVINLCFGGFSLSNMAVEALGLRSPWADVSRTDERLIALVEQDAEAASGACARLAVAEIPDEATDWYIEEYDGSESLIYVLDGRLHWWQRNRAEIEDNEE